MPTSRDPLLVVFAALSLGAWQAPPAAPDSTSQDPASTPAGDLRPALPYKSPFSDQRPIEKQSRPSGKSSASETAVPVKSPDKKKASDSGPTPPVEQTPVAKPERSEPLSLSYYLGTRYNYALFIKDRLGVDASQSQRLYIRKRWKPMLDVSGYGYALVDPAADQPNLGYEGPSPPPLYDLTGDGIHDLVIRLWTGGAHCCYTYDIYSLDAKFKHIWHFSAGDGHMLTMRP
ncbi:MAG TPA: hypothetical protein V6C72_10845, partial [Chroococcales cyanobacterium]